MIKQINLNKYLTKQQRFAILKVQRKESDKQTRKQKIKKITITLDKVTTIRYNKGTKKGKTNYEKHKHY